MKPIYIHEDSGCAYKIGEGGEMEWCPLEQGNMLFTEDMFGPIDYESIGNEMIDHEGKQLTIKEFEVILRELLS